jgi:hypothetical protein
VEQLFAWSELAPDEVLLALRDTKASGFLDTHQYAAWGPAAEVLLNGGYPHAQLRRAALAAAPQVRCWTMRRSDLPPNIAVPRQLRGYIQRELGLSDAVGDIVIGEHVAVAANPEVDLAELFPGAVWTDGWEPPAVRPERATAAGLRLDSIVAALFRVSRGEAQTAIEYGFVFLNFAPALKRTLAVKAGDQLVYRTKGRCELASLGENTRSGRAVVEFKRFPL